MDVDEFLDKETQIEKKEEIDEKAIQIPKEDKENIKNYFEIWNKISEAKFKWDSELYAEVSKAGEDIEKKSGKLLSTIEREKSTIKRLIGKVVEELKNKNYDSATKLYSEISDIRNNFPEFFLEERKEINKEIFRLYEKLHDEIDLKFINDFKSSIAQVDDFISSSYSSLDAGDADKAKLLYGKALEIYKDLPNGFLSRKMELGTWLLNLYKDLSIRTQIENLQQQLSKSGSYKQISEDEKLKDLLEVIKYRNIERGKISEKKASLSELMPVSDEEEYHIQDKALLSRLIVRKMERARINQKKGLYLEVKKNLDSILKVDPDNIEAKEMLDSLPVQY
ncbi:MAG: hypothetical protein V1831_00390 [Candidatus Woesearchaeota archaeon]